MGIESRIAKLEKQTPPPGMTDREWRAMLNRISKVYGDGSTVEGDTPALTPAELEKIIDRVYSDQ